MGEKASLNLEKRFRLLVFKEKSYTCNNAEIHPRLCPSSVINSLEFFRFIVVFLQPFFLSSVFFSPLPFLQDIQQIRPRDQRAPAPL